MHFLFLLRALFDRGLAPDDISLAGEISLDRPGSSAHVRRGVPLGGAGSSAGGAVVPRGLRSEVETVEPSLFQVGLRVALLVFVGAYWLGARLADALFVGWTVFFSVGGTTRRHELLAKRRAVRLRELLQGLGGTFVKVGQQLSIRSDVLPRVYCQELQELGDKAGPLDFSHVRSTVEAETERELEEVFVEIDRDAIGQASIACVYRARLANGDRVAVKIRRPRIIELFKADLYALDLAGRFLEFITYFRGGYTEPLREELRKLLLEELDLRTEARYQELFRRYIKEWDELRVTAPATYPALCSERMIVAELVDDALSARRVLEILASDDPAERRILDERNIDPAKVARHLIRASHFQFFDCPFFHGDPHPSNVMIRDDSEVVLIDFGACGVFAETQRNYLRRMNHYQAQEDIGGMVQCVIRLMEPLPPLELSSFRRDLEAAWWQGFYGIQSRHAEWWERTSFRLWTALLRTVRDYEIPMPLNVLRMIRATLLYDTLGAQLYPSLDVFEEYHVYLRWAARRTKRDMENWLADQLVCGIDPLLFLRARQVVDVADGFLFEAQRFLHDPRPSFTALIGKTFTLIQLALSWLVWGTIYTAFAIAAIVFFHVDALRGSSLADMSLHDYWVVCLEWVGKGTQLRSFEPSHWVALAWLVFVLSLTFKVLRAAGCRLNDKDEFL